jgi:F0F1-type ATP synthase membrane subunit b/b'
LHINPGEILYIFFLGLILFFVLRKKLFEPVGNIIQDRESFIEDAKTFIAKTETDLQEKKILVENRLNEAAVKAYEMQEKFRQEGYKERKDSLRVAQDDSARMLDDARQNIRQTVDEAEIALNKETEKLAGEIVTALMGRT